MGKPRRSHSLVAVVIALGLPSLAAAETLTFSWDSRPLEISTDSDGNAAVRMEGAVSSTEIGAPDLPWVPASIDLEPGQTVVSWRFVPDQARTLQDGIRPARIQPAESSSGLDASRIAPDPAVSHGDYPLDSAIFMGVRSTRGRVSAGFLFSAFRWQANTGRLDFVPGGTLELELGPAPSGKFLGPPLRESADRLRALPRDSASQPGRIVSAYSGGLTASELPSLEGVAVSCVIVTSDELAASFQWLADWKTRSGYPTEIRTLSWIYQHYPHGADQPEKIRLFLRDAYRYWGTQSVIMGGDPSIVPIRVAKSYSWNSPEGVDITTDYYYACLDGSWNDNGNSIYGQAIRRFSNNIGDGTDLSPELWVGRIPASGVAEVNIYRTKYETYAINASNLDHAERVLTMGEVLFDPDWNAGDCDICQGCADNRPCVNRDGASDCFALIERLRANEAAGEGWVLSELYERDAWWRSNGHPTAQPLGLPEALGVLNSGVNIVFHSGHGDRDRWAIGSGRLESRHLRGLTNGPRYSGMVYSINCNSAAVAFDCLAEAWCFSPTGGGLIYVGSTNLDFPTVAGRFQDRTFDRWPGDGTVTLGEAFYGAADSVASEFVPLDWENTYRFVLYSLIFLGDPDMHVWWTTPATLAVVHPSQITLGTQSTDVTVSLDGAALEGAKVTLYKGGDAMAVGTTGPGGVVSLPFIPSTTGDFQVTVQHPRGKPYQGSGTVAAPTSASFVTVTDFEIDDVTDAGAGIKGNGNGRIEVGETVGIDLNLVNRGGAAANDATAILALRDDAGLEVTILDGLQELGTIGAGGVSASARAFQIRVEEGAEATDRTLETVELEISVGPASDTHPEIIRPNAYRPRFTLFASTALEITDTGGEPDGIPEGGDVWKVAFEFRNEGEGTASGLQVRLAPAPNNGIAISPEEPLLLPDAERFQTVSSDTFGVSFFVNNQTRMEVSLEDGRTDPPTQLWKRVYDLLAPTTPVGLNARGLRSSIALTWKRPPDPDLAGYRVYRSAAAAGPYERIGTGFVSVVSAVADTAYFADEGLPPLTRYFYRVATVDLSGHESALSDSFPMSTSPGNVEGWPVALDDPSGAAPTIEDLNGWGDFEVLTASDVIYALLSDGSDYFDGDSNPTTRGKLTSPTVGDDYKGKPAVADLDGDGTVEVIAVPNFRRLAEGEPRNSDLVVFDNLGGVKWRKAMTTSPVVSSPALGDLDGDSDLEIVVLASRSVYAFHGDGTPVGSSSDGRLIELSTNDGYFLYGSVALADVVGGAGAEIIFTTRTQDPNGNTKLFVLNADGTNVPGFPYSYFQSGSSRDGSNSSPAVADIIKGDEGRGEVVVTTKDRVWLIDPTNTAGVVRWQRNIGTNAIENPLNSSPALGDIDRDGQLEVVVGGANGRLFVLNAATGAPHPSFDEGAGYLQISQTNARMGSPIIGDLTGDDFPEILIGDNLGLVHCYQRDGQPLPGFPFVMGGVISGGLAMWDIDKDGHVNLVVQAEQVQNLLVLDFPQSQFNHGNPDLDRYPWTQFRHDAHNSGWLPTPPLLPLALQAPELTANAGLEVHLRWVGQSGFSKFLLYRRLAQFEDFTLVGDWKPEEVAQGSGSEFATVDLVPEAGTYVYRLVGVEPGGFEVTTADREITVATIGLSFALHAPRPNPFEASATIRLDLPKGGKVSLRVLDPSGRRVRTLLEGHASAGSYTRVWDGKDDRGRPVGAGVYFISASAAGVGESSVKLIHLR